MMYYDQFNTGKRIQKLRRERYLTQEELAVRLNVSARHLRQEESLRNKLQQKRLTNQKLRLKLQRIMQKLSAIAEEL